MSSSKAGGSGEPSRSSSAIVAHTARGCHIFKIDGYSLTKNLPTGEYIKSTPFIVGGYRWCLTYYPNGKAARTADYIAIYLELDDMVPKAVKAQYQFRFADEVEEDPVELEEVDSFDSRSGWGYTMFVTREELEASEHLKDDSFSIRCDIILVNEFRVEETSSSRSPHLTCTGTLLTSSRLEGAPTWCSMWVA
jgi:speckle-type POZ protein